MNTGILFLLFFAGIFTVILLLVGIVVTLTAQDYGHAFSIAACLIFLLLGAVSGYSLATILKPETRNQIAQISNKTVDDNE